MKDLFMSFRTQSCGALREAHQGQQVELSGWVDTVRDHGGILFIDLRDRYGTTQVVFDPEVAPEAYEIAHASRSEFVITVKGEVLLRPGTMVNKTLPTGGIEVKALSAQILNRSKTPPFRSTMKRPPKSVKICV